MERKLNKTDRWMVIWVHVSTEFQFLFYGIHILTAHQCSTNVLTSARFQDRIFDASSFTHSIHKKFSRIICELRVTRTDNIFFKIGEKNVYA